MKVEIESLSNGYIVKWGLDSVEDQAVFEDTGKNKAHIVKMLYRVIEIFGEVGTKHDKDRVRIVRVNQDGKEVV